MVLMRLYKCLKFPRYKSTLYFLFIECVIESEGVILHVFGDAIYFELRLVNFNLWVRA